MPATQDNAPPSPSGSSASDGSSNSVSTGPPRTPVSTSLPMPTFMNFTGEDTLNGVASLGGIKRTSKTTRRVNTAERRATHNAVERQRRETLNGRFLDLAALLSNLSQIRRPSKSAIVNSSIAHLNASRRHRILAAQQLRMMKNEADALRHEVNEWRARAGVAFVEEPMRGDAFGIVLRGELEFEAGDMVEGEEGEEDDEAGGTNGGVYGGRQYAPERAAYTEEPVDEYALLQRQQQEHADMMAAQMQAPFDHTVLHPSTPPHALPEQAYPINPGHRQPVSAHYYTPSPTIASPVISYENPAMAYEHAPVHPAMQAELNAHWAFEKQQQILHAHHQEQQRQANW
ncbi:hypothetical protein C8F04DRAFT_1096324 [Mycena alexandri]|uniref:BHLH domain-containing protein n=1 Tax=Mycena alexandri TaxID=1745969 RepID=A0AAD6T2J2_9AGAR|nr:hypothetical protein C8F04DRAFT_1096324 [Mycena alexandri]